jgi:hypothetical protein
MKYEEDFNMKRKIVFKGVLYLFLAAIFLFTGQAAHAFSSGSTGIHGALEPIANVELTIPETESGVFNYTTINIPTGVTVTFKKDSKNSPIIILASGNVTISGTISVNGANGTATASGAGGPAGFNGGIGGDARKAGLRGEGSGGGGYGYPCSVCTPYGGGGAGGGYLYTGSNGNYSSSNVSSGSTGGSIYGNERILPTIGGSGGGGGGGSAYPGAAGAGGGGAILIASSGTITVNGSVTANGGTGGQSANTGCGYTGCSGCGGGGSGGSIRLVSNYIAGSGSLSVAGGNGGDCNYTSSNDGGTGSAGRIRLEAITVSSLNTNPSPASIALNISDNHEIFPTNAPTLAITSVGGIQAPTQPRGLIGAPDVSIPFNITNPVTVVVTCKNIPASTTVTVKASPSSGTQTSATGTLDGTMDSTSASIPINISTSYPSILTASVTLVATALNGGLPIYAEGERVEKVRIETAMGGESKMIYITESGREIPATTHKS